VIVGNTVMGNANGITIVAGAEGNVVVSNVVVGNPPAEVSVSQPATAGVDIRNLARPGSNIFESNVCLTPVNAECSTAGAPLLPR
jgi:parallel beta-helix repeat protein